MKTNWNKTVILVISTLAIGLFFGWLIFSTSDNKVSYDHNHKKEFANETIWTCSMHPQIRQNEPGQCPICGMDLIPLDSQQATETDPMAISMSPTAMQLANITTAIVGTTNPVKTILLNGKVQADERLVYSQSSHVPGRIEELMINFTGEFVNKGQIIAYIYSPEMVTAQEELFEAQKIKETQPQFFIAAKEKLRNWKMSDSQIEQILKSGSKDDKFPIRADVSGFVTKKMVNLGDYVRKGESLYHISDLSKIWLLFDVYENDMPWVKKGNKISITIQSQPGELFEGVISFIDPVIDSRTRVAKARVEIKNSSLKLKPEMFASGIVEAKLPNSSNSIVIPKTAIMWTGKRSVVYVKTDTDKNVSFMMRNVTLGPALGESYIIESGLQEGEKIAINGTFSIDAASQLAGKPSMMSPEGGPAMTGHNHEDKNNVPSNKQISTSDKSSAINQKAKDALQPLFLEYLKLKDALVADKSEEAKKSGVNERIKKIKEK